MTRLCCLLRRWRRVVRETSASRCSGCTCSCCSCCWRGLWLDIRRWGNWRDFNLDSLWWRSFVHGCKKGIRELIASCWSKRGQVNESRWSVRRRRVSSSPRLCSSKRCCWSPSNATWRCCWNTCMWRQSHGCWSERSMRIHCPVMMMSPSTWIHFEGSITRPTFSASTTWFQDN